jgi:hypothetical protein
MKPMLFNTKMVRAILSGIKTVTRRVIKDPYYIDNEETCRVSGCAIHKGTTYTYGMPWPDSPYTGNDIIWVRETWATTENGQDYLYKADSDTDGVFIRDKKGALHCPRWRPSIHMPKEAARIFLRVTDVRIERLQEIDADGVWAEGMTTLAALCGNMEIAAQEFALLWDSTIKPTERELYGWAANPWVWVIEFERCERPKSSE